MWDPSPRRGVGASAGRLAVVDIGPGWRGCGETAGDPWFRKVPRWRVIAAAVFVGIIIAEAVPGVLGHVVALLVWAGATWSCLRPWHGGGRGMERQ